MKIKKKSKIAHFSFEERVKIETYLDEGLSKRKIAEKLGRTPRAVRKEIARNSVRNRYRALKAQVKSYQRRWKVQKDVLKIAMNSLLQKYVEKNLKQYWSPESISGRLKYVDRHLPYVGKDAVYAYVASVHGRSLEKYLWWKGKKHKPRIPREVILNRTMIDERPKSVETRHYYGDWEGDFIVSGKDGSGALLVLVERKSRYVIIWKLFDRKIATVNSILSHVFGGGQLVMRSLTLDNDISFRMHEEMSILIGAPVFFCHPYHSWEKGQVEKMNQLIRRFIPKRTDISKVPDDKIRWVEGILNNKPLECLQFKTPAEMFARSAKLKTFVTKKMIPSYYSLTQVGWGL
jgi:transposase, IS30 family